MCDCFNDCCCYEKPKPEKVYIVFKRLENGGLRLENVRCFAEQYQASNFVKEQNRLIDYVRRFAELQKTNPLKIPEFSKPEPVIDLVKRKELTDTMNHGADKKQRRAAGKAFERFKKEFDLVHSEWLKEKESYILSCMQSAIQPIVGGWELYRFDNHIVIDIIDLYTKGESYYTDFIYEMETVQFGS